MKKKRKQTEGTVPAHIGIIMDGNGRWAERKNLPRIAGHQEGLKAVRKAVKAADRHGIRYLTLYSFSAENWKRPEEEVKFLFSLMEQRLRIEGEDLHRNRVRVRFIGRRGELPAVLVSTMSGIEKMTARNTGLTLTFAINYGGRQEIVDAAKKILHSGVSEKEVDEDLIEKNLYTAGIPAPDLIIRTSGEKRLSNFMLWQAAYAELYFTAVLWPDFDEEDFLKALEYYRKRKRKFGGIK